MLRATFQSPARRRRARWRSGAPAPGAVGERVPSPTWQAPHRRSPALRVGGARSFLDTSYSVRWSYRCGRHRSATTNESTYPEGGDLAGAGAITAALGHYRPELPLPTRDSDVVQHGMALFGRPGTSERTSGVFSTAFVVASTVPGVPGRASAGVPDLAVRLPSAPDCAQHAGVPCREHARGHRRRLRRLGAVRHRQSVLFDLF